MRYTMYMFEVITIIFWGLVLLTAIVFIHEVGHYTAARAFGLRVKEFMIGLPGPKISVKRKDTQFGVTAIPLGGYCLIAGMEKGVESPEVEKALTFIAYFGEMCEDRAERAAGSLGFDLVGGLDTLADWGTVRRYKARKLYHYAISAATVDGVSFVEGQPRKIANPKAFLDAERKLTYIAMPWWKRVVILLSGTFSNLVVAMVILITLLMAGGVQISTTVVDQVVEDSPAAAAGMVPGDQLVSLAGQRFDTWNGFVTELAKLEAGTTVVLGYTHEGTLVRATITLDEREGRPLVGVVSRSEPYYMGFLDAANLSITLVGMTLAAIMQLLNPATFADTIGQASSVVGISVEAANAAASGPTSFIILIAALSISIGFMNMLPIPPLDGGKIIIESIERLFRRRLPVSVVNGISLAGLAAMILLFIMATNSDIHRYFLGG